MNIQKTFILLFCFTLSIWGYAQETAQDSRSRSSSTLDTLEVTGTVDSLQAQTSTVDSVQQKVLSKLDSLQSPEVKIDAVDSTRQATQAKIDSLKALDLPHEKYTQKLDSLNQLPANTVNKAVDKAEEAVQKKVEQVKDKISGKAAEKGLEGVEDKIPNEKLPGVDGADVTGVPDADIDTGEIVPDDLNKEFGLGTDSNLDVGETVGLEGSTAQVDELTNAPADKINELKKAGNIDQVSEQVNKIGEAGEQVSGVTEDIQKAREGDTEGVEKRIEEQAISIDELKELQRQSAEMEKLKKEHEAYKAQLQEQPHEVTQYSDPEFVKQRLMEKSKNVAGTDILKQYQSKVQAAQLELSSLKKPEFKTDSLKGLKVRTPNPLHDKPLRERMRPGFLMEINRKDNHSSIDLAPLMAYRMNDKFKVYGSYIYRFSFDTEENAFAFNDPTYGPRLLATYTFYKGFFVKGAWEQVRTNVPRSFNSPEFTREWVRGAFVGIGREYAFARKVLGNIQVMYNFMHSEDSPYPKKFNIRFGFEFDLKKGKKQKLVVPKGTAIQKKL
ncbi:hypothetical protein GCM10009122_50500 [Fulvivirga kasyanovii]|uniref:Outer membrane protein beta-barrel domain-containing protein n=1 Tax=Fulvivirga kasyanovii TaxID=396812 RepID=A0ABW9RMB0_9BACT|nr:hypothetical protein [Fulvivirga kasyanovii]MTI24484.1 hypothetical protein [Fulvivirga kasyanovii]